MIKPLLAVAIVLLPTGALMPADECLHGRAETDAQRIRRDKALQVARLVNLAESRPTAPAPGRYRPLQELSNVPPAPAGFDVRLMTDGKSYLLSIKDTLDACHYAIFSDEDARVYEAVPSTKPVILPATTHQ